MISAEPPAASTLKTEVDYLRAMVHASIQIGGPDSLPALRDDAGTIVNVVKASPFKRRTRRAILGAMLRLIELTSKDPAEAERIRARVLSTLFPRPPDRRAWHHTSRWVRGSTEIDRQRPTIEIAQLRTLVETAGMGKARSGAGPRDRTICALYCFSGVSPGELHTLTWE